MNQEIYSKRTWFYDGKWIEGPNLRKGRVDFSFGIIRDPVTDQVYIVVTGGHGDDGTFVSSDVEILSVTGTAWETGKLL